MPYIKPRDPPFIRVTRLIKGYGYDPAGLSRLLGCSWRTAKAKMDEPERFTLGDLMEVSRKAHIPLDEIREALVR